jgi:hypothetical protein
MERAPQPVSNSPFLRQALISRPRQAGSGKSNALSKPTPRTCVTSGNSLACARPRTLPALACRESVGFLLPLSNTKLSSDRTESSKKAFLERSYRPPGTIDLDTGLIQNVRGKERSR